MTQSANTAYAFDAKQFIFNVDDYMDNFGRAAVSEIGTEVDADIALNAISGVRNSETGALVTHSGPYRFFGNAKDAINSYTQLARMITLFKTYGAVKTGIKVYLPDTVVPDIIGTGLNQFVPQRNEEDFNSWQLGEFGTPPVKYYESNLMPEHIAGNVGNADPVMPLTVVSTNDPSGANVTQITFSGASNNDLDAIKAGDLIQFDLASNLRFRTFIGHKPTTLPVQLRAIEDAASNASGEVTIRITPKLQWIAGAEQNLTRAIAAGMQAQVMPSHQAGLVVGGNALFVGMLTLPDEDPFKTAYKVDEETGVSMRMYYGSKFGENQRGFVNDCIWGSTLVPEYSMRILFPL